MPRGTRADFWATVEIGHRLSSKGWIPWSLAIDRRIKLNLEDRRCRFFLHAAAGPFGCYAGGSVWIPERCRLPDKALRRILRQLAGPGRLMRNPKNRLHLLRAMTSTDDIMCPQPTSGRAARKKLPTTQRAKLIRVLLEWLRPNQTLRWSAYSIDYRAVRRGSSGGVRWTLCSDLYFVRKEGLYWNNLLTLRRVGSTRRDLLIRRVEKGLTKMGFRIIHVSPRPPFALVFDQDHLPRRELLRKASLLARWAPR